MLNLRVRLSIGAVLIALAPVLTGCSGGIASPMAMWPFGQDEKSDYQTPAKRMEALRSLAAGAQQKSPEEQEKIAARLAQLIQAEEDPLVREEIVRTLANYQSKTAQAVVRAALKDNDPEVRITAIRKLAEQTTGDVAAALAAVVQSDTDDDVRLAATRELRRFKDPKAVQALTVALDDSNPALQLRAMDSLREVTDQDFGNDVVAWRQHLNGEQPRDSGTSIARQLRGWLPF